MARRQTVRFQCGHDGCKEFAVYECWNADERKRLYESNGNGKYRCTRHTRMDELLSPENRLISCEVVSEEFSHGKFWGRAGFVSGPGFKAFCADFPEGTILRVTAEVILPTGPVITQQPSGPR